jgi:hypothetical protein
MLTMKIRQGRTNPAIAPATRSCRSFFIDRNRIGGTVRITRSVAFFALLAQLVLQGAATSRAETMPWQEAVSRLASERAMAETCAALLKKHGDGTQKAHGEITYTSAKADSDAVITGLITALSSGEAPGGLPGLQARLNSSVSSNVSGLIEFCSMVRKLIPDTAGQKGTLTDIAIPLEHLLTRLSDGIAAISIYYRSDDALTRRTIRTQLEAARWPAFSEIKEQ